MPESGTAGNLASDSHAMFDGDLDYDVAGDPAQFAQQNPLVLDVFEDVAQDRQIEESVGVGDVIAIEGLDFHQTLEFPGGDRLGGGRRYFQRVQLARKAAVIENLQQTPLARTNIDDPVEGGGRRYGLHVRHG